MNIYILIGIVVFSLIFRLIVSKNVKKSERKTPPLFEEKEDKSVFESFFEEILKEKEDNLEIKPPPVSAIKKTNKTDHPIKINTQRVLIEEDENIGIDLREAIIYSEIINNPFIEKNR